MCSAWFMVTYATDRLVPADTCNYCAIIPKICLQTSEARCFSGLAILAWDLAGPCLTNAELAYVIRLRGGRYNGPGDVPVRAEKQQHRLSGP